MTQQNAIVQATEGARRGDDAMMAVLRSYETNLAAIMPKHVQPDTFIGLAMAYVRRDQFLSRAAAANPLSLVTALREIAAWGHVPMKGTAALVAFQSKKDGDNGWAITAIEEVGGVVQRIYRAGGVVALHCDVVRFGEGAKKPDKARFQRTTMSLPYHEYDEYASEQERGPLQAVYAYATLMSGHPSSVVWMPRSTVLKHRAASKSAQKGNGGNFWGPPWPEEGPWTEDMWKKTALHKLATLVPSSAEYRWQLASAEAAAASATGLPDAPVTAEASFGADYIETSWTEPQSGSGAAGDGTGDEPPYRAEWPDTARPADAS